MTKAFSSPNEHTHALSKLAAFRDVLTEVIVLFTLWNVILIFMTFSYALELHTEVFLKFFNSYMCANSSPASIVKEREDKQKFS